MKSSQKLSPVSQSISQSVSSSVSPGQSVSQPEVHRGPQRSTEVYRGPQRSTEVHTKGARREKRRDFFWRFPLSTEVHRLIFEQPWQSYDMGLGLSIRALSHEVAQGAAPTCIDLMQRDYTPLAREEPTSSCRGPHRYKEKTNMENKKESNTNRHDK